MDKALAPHEPVDRAARCGPNRTPLLQDIDHACVAAHRDGMDQFAVEPEEMSARRVAQPHRLVEHRVEDGREMTRCGVDNLQHLGSRRLLFEGFARLAQEPRILDRDDRLIGEGSDQFDLPLAEWMNPLTRESENPDRLPVAR